MVQDKLSSLFKEMGCDVQLATSIEGGAADIHLTDRNVIIEVKASGKAGPDKPGSARKGRGATTQREQLFAYVEGMRRQTRTQLDLPWNAECPWVGILTDGLSWWVWKWSSKGEAPRKPLTHFSLASDKEDAALQKVQSLLEATESGKPWIPSDLARLFTGFEDQLDAIYLDASEKTSIQTKVSVWLELLKASGMAPKSQRKRDALFVKHTYLVAIAKAVIAALSHEPHPTHEALRNHFASWVLEVSDGRKWVQRLFEFSAKYDWRARPVDVLRSLYQDVIPVADRKAYGEYYTPDYLAEGIVERVLDNRWCETAAQAALELIDGHRDHLDGIGVLDPTCGSGTFLYHAARRLLDSAALVNRNNEERAECVAHLVHGIDIHPVAVEMARATLLRALPAQPRGGVDVLNVSQGDSLIASGGDTLLTEVSFPSVERRYFVLPRELILSTDFRKSATKLIESVERDEKQPPRVLYKDHEEQDIRNAHIQLKNVYRERGNGIWLWLIINSVAPHRLAERKVNRIVANPPWVRMSNIQVPERKNTLIDMATVLMLWVGGKNATGFDIAALFIVRCLELYLTKSGGASAWITNAAAISGDNWARFHNQFVPQECWDFSKLQKQPFKGAKSCVWFEDNGNNKIADYEFKRLVNKSGTKIKLTDSWDTVMEKVTFKKVPIPLRTQPNPSEYKGMFRQGVTLLPNCLIRVKIAKQSSGRGLSSVTKKNLGTDKRISFTCVISRHVPWNKVPPQSGTVPARWIKKTVISRDLLPFALRTELTQCVIPVGATGTLEPAPHRENYWQSADKYYQEFKSAADHTPQTLLDRIDYQHQLSVQLGRNRFSGLVIYNSSGQLLRAAYTNKDVIIEHGCYYYQPKFVAEGHYLAAVLNASCLQFAYAEARKSDRHFLNHIWQYVSIPRFAHDHELHSELAKLGKRAQQEAQKFIKNYNAQAGQIKISQEIRQAIVASGTMNKINTLVSKLLPKYANVEINDNS